MSHQRVLSTVAAAALITLPGALRAQPPAHYCPGVEGVMAASLPPPGFYARDYNVFYWSDRDNDPSGHSAGPPNFKAFTYAQVPRLVWVADDTVLGANYGVSALLPFIDTELQAGAYDNHSFGMGDLLVDGILAWHPSRFDLIAAAGFWAPTGQAATQPTDPGKGYWTGMLTLGGTWYMDADKTWTVSALNRYEFNAEQRNTHITPGQAYTLEWGVAKKLQKIVDVGAAGYFQQKVTRDSGMGALPFRSRVASVGPEIGVAIPKLEAQVSLRYLYEFIAEDRAQGQAVTLTLTKRF